MSAAATFFLTLALVAAPPAGVVPSSSTTLARVLALHKAASGPVPRSSVERWTFTSEGLEGTETIYTAGDDLREDDTIGPFQSASGVYGGQRWRQNENGLTLRLRGLHRESDVDEGALRDALKPASAVRLLGETASPAAYVVQVDPKGGRTEWIFYDKTTYLIVRRETVWEDQRVIETYDDFRTSGGITRAWHVHSTDGRPFNDSDFTLRSYEPGTPVDALLLKIPENRRAMYAVLAGKTALPARIIDDRIILNVEIDGHPANFQLDSGASGIVIDEKAADRLGLKRYGQTTGATAGTYTSHRTLLPHVAVGDIRMNDVAVEALPFLNMADDKTYVIGLIGFDFIAGSVIHVDYLNGKVEAVDAASFLPPPHALTIPIALDDGVPFATGSVGGVSGTGFIIDTGADRSTLFSGFETRHPEAMTDQGLGDAIEASYPFVDHLMGVGGKINVRAAQLKDFRFAGLRFAQWLFMVTQERKSFEGEDIDGLIGQDFLRNFDLYLDYSRSSVYLVPNDRFKARWPHAAT